MRTISETAARRDRIARLDRLAERLDARFRVPVIGIRFGWDSIIGLVPGLGDAATALPGLFMIYEGARIGVRNRVLARMGLNLAVDLALGSVPVLGDLLDVFFKSHRRNIALLRDELRRIETAELPLALPRKPARAGLLPYYPAEPAEGGVIALRQRPV